MSALPLLLLSCLALLAGYLIYGRWLARRLGIDPGRTTPAHTMRDGVDYVPARPQVLLGHHFSSIAGAAPIIGPVLAVAFGWLPVWLWIILGGIFMGAVHDFAALVASLRHQGRSIGQVLEEQVGRRARMIFLLFAWLMILLVIAAFTILVAKTFEKTPTAATSSTMMTAFAVGLGLLLYRLRLPTLWATLASLALIALALWSGHLWPMPAALTATGWRWILLAYVFLASVAPVWILLQPRDYMNSFLLFGLMGAGLVGALVANPTLELPGWQGFVAPGLGPLFPMLFVILACGAISGFHSLVSSGTTAKQLDRESQALPITFGAMLIESLLAVIALITVAMLTGSEYAAQDPVHKNTAITIFAGGMGRLMASLGFAPEAGRDFAALAVAAFALTSLDTATRIARLALQEIIAPATGAGGPTARLRRSLAANRWLATTITVAAGGTLALTCNIKSIWPIFGAANQMLAALGFLAILAWLTHRGGRHLYILLPTVFMFLVTTAALVWKAKGFLAQGNPGMAVLSVVLTLLSLYMAGEAILALGRNRREPPATPADRG